MVERTVSELAFEVYLSKQGIIFRYEELPNGITQPADYSFEIAGKTLRIDVKEWAPRKQLQGEGPFNPYKPVRKKIEEGRKKFKQYKNRDEPCVLVLCHRGTEPILLDAIYIFGSMRGNLASAFPINPDTGVGDASKTHIMFTNGGKMIHQTTKNSVRVQNTSISAVAVLETIRVRYRRVYITLRRRKAMEGRDFTPGELLTV